MHHSLRRRGHYEGDKKRGQLRRVGHKPSSFADLLALVPV